MLQRVVTVAITRKRIIPAPSVVYKSATAEAVKAAMADRKASGVPPRIPVTPRGPIEPIPALWSGAVRRSSEFWDFYRDGISFSALEKFLLCREQFRLRYVEGWRGPDEGIALAYGNAFHWFLTRFNRNASGPFDCVRAIRTYDAEWQRENPGAFPSAIETHELVLAYCLGVWQEYVKWFPEDRRKAWVEVEDEWEMPYEFSEQVLFGPKQPTKIRGVCDGAYKESKGEGVRIFETKTRDRIDEGAIEDTLHMDFQTMLYAWTFWKRTGILPVGTTYNVVRRPVLKLNKEKDKAELAHRIVKDVKDRPDWYFHRFNTNITQSDLENFHTYQLQPLLLDVSHWSEGGPHYCNPAALISFGKRCQLFGLITSGDTTGLRRRELKKKEKER